MTDAPRRPRNDLIEEILGATSDLAEPYEHSEPLRLWRTDRQGHRRQLRRVHRSRHPSLLNQLRERVSAVFRETAATGHVPPTSRPPLDLSAVAALQEIAADVRFWVRSLNLQPWYTLDGQIRVLAEVAPRLGTSDLTALARDVTRWRALALGQAGWTSRPWAPNAACPACASRPGERSGLRIRLDEMTARCLSCRTTWDPNQFRILARMIADSLRTSR